MKYRKLLTVILCLTISTNLSATSKGSKGFKIEGGDEKTGLGKDYTPPITAVKVKAIFNKTNNKNLVTPTLPQKSSYLKKLQGLKSTEGKAGKLGMNEDAGLNGTGMDNQGKGLKAILDSCADFYINNVARYVQDHGNDYSKGKSKYVVYPDCSGFACFFMSNVSGKQLNTTNSSGFSGGTHKANWEAAGWKMYKPKDLKSANEILPGDIMSKSGTHVELVYDSTHTFGWGAVQKKKPSSGPGEYKIVGNTIKAPDGGSYDTIWRYVGKK